MKTLAAIVATALVGCAHRIPNSLENIQYPDNIYMMSGKTRIETTEVRIETIVRNTPIVLGTGVNTEYETTIDIDGEPYSLTISLTHYDTHGIGELDVKLSNGKVERIANADDLDNDFKYESILLQDYNQGELLDFAVLYDGSFLNSENDNRQGYVINEVERRGLPQFFNTVPYSDTLIPATTNKQVDVLTDAFAALGHIAHMLVREENTTQSFNAYLASPNGQKDLKLVLKDPRDITNAFYRFYGGQ